MAQTHEGTEQILAGTGRKENGDHPRLSREGIPEQMPQLRRASSVSSLTSVG